MSIFDPLWKRTVNTFDKNQEKRIQKAIASLDKMTDNKKLLEVVVQAPVLKVAEAAAGKITDEKMLYDIASGNYGRDAHGYDIEIRKTAVWKIKDMSLLSLLEKDPEPKIADIASNHRHALWQKSMREKYQPRTVEELRDLQDQADDREEKTLIGQIMHEKNELVLGPIADSGTGKWRKEKGLTNSYEGTYETDAVLYCFTCRKQTPHRVEYRRFRHAGRSQTETISVQCKTCKNKMIYDGPDSIGYQIMRHNYE